MKVLIACEESQRVCCAFRELGHEAYSCDIQEPSGGHPEWHILGDALRAIEGGEIVTMDGKAHYIGKWDLLIAHPPCTYLSNAGAAYFSAKWGEERIMRRRQKQQEAIWFFMQFIKADCPKIAVENPVGRMSTLYKKPTQIIQPYQFGDHAQKKTCLWLKGLPKLEPTNIVDRGEMMGNYSIGAHADGRDDNGKWLRWGPELAKLRSRTFPGIAKAMAEQWGGKVNDTENTI